MKKFNLIKVSNEKGFTLVELLVSFVLITLLLTTFIMMFAQAAKTNGTSENIVDSTYIAQAEMEKIYGISKKTAPENKVSAFPTTNYEAIPAKTIEGTNWLVYEKKNPPYKTKIIIRLENLDDPNEKMTRIIVEVYEGTKANPTAKMENVLVWEGTS